MANEQVLEMFQRRQVSDPSLNIANQKKLVTDVFFNLDKIP